MTRRMLGVGVLAGLALFGSGPARAQFGNPNPGPPVTVPLPPPALGPSSLGLLEQDFQQMRRTSPNPDSFMGGRWNPRFQTIVPNSGFGGGTWWVPYGGWGYYPYGGYYGGGIYLGGGYPYGVYGGGYGGYGGGYGGYNNYNYNVNPPAVVLPPAASGAAPATPAPTAPTSPPARDDYYLRRGAEESLSDALDDIRKAWLNGDAARLQARVAPDTGVRVSSNGQYRYTMTGAEFSTMLRSAMKRIDTVAFELDRPKSTERGRVTVTGKHTYLDRDKRRQTVSISYTLEQINGRWLITGAGSTTPAVAPARE